MTTGKSETLERFQAYAQREPFMNLIFTILGWFAVTVEVFLRRDFGERYFTRTKFIMGFLLLVFITVVGRIGSGIGRAFSTSSPSPVFDPEQGVWVQPEPSFTLGISVMPIILLLYIFLSGYHTFSTWWRNGTGRPLHSYDHGISWLEPVGALILVVPNFFVGILAKLYALTLPEQERAWLVNALPLIRDVRTFTENSVEPAVLFLLGIVFSALGSPAVASWLFVSTFAVVFFTIIRHEMENNAYLDLRDQMIESVYMKDAMRGDTQSLRVPYGVKKVLFETATQAEKAPGTMEAVRQNYPTVAEAMEAINPKLKAMTSKKENAAPSSSPPPAPPVAAQEPPSPVAPEEMPPAQEEPKKEGGLSVEDALAALKPKKNKPPED